MYMIEPGNETEDEIAYAQNDGGGSWNERKNDTNNKGMLV